MPRSRCCVNLIPCSHGEGRVLWGTARLPLGKVMVSDGDLMDQGPVLTWNSPASHSVGVQSTVSGSRRFWRLTMHSPAIWAEVTYIHTYIWLLSCVWLLGPHGLYSSRFFCPWDSVGKNAGVDCHFLLQGIFPTPWLNLGFLLCRQILYVFTDWIMREAPEVTFLTHWSLFPQLDKKDSRDFKLKNFLWSLS